MYAKVRAFVLALRELSESDLLVFLLSQELGKVSCVAKGARRSMKRFVNKLEPFYLIGAELRRVLKGTNLVLESAELIKVPEAMRVDPLRYALGVYLLEVSDRACLLLQGSELFSLLLKAQQVLDSEDFSLLLKPFFELRLLSVLGWSPEVKRCVRCRRTLSDAYFCAESFGLLCRDCAPEGSLRLDSRERRLLEGLLSRSYEEVKAVRPFSGKIFDVSEALILKVLDQEVRSLKVLKEFCERYLKEGKREDIKQKKLFWEV